MGEAASGTWVGDSEGEVVREEGVAEAVAYEDVDPGFTVGDLVRWLALRDPGERVFIEAECGHVLEELQFLGRRESGGVILGVL